MTPKEKAKELVFKMYSINQTEDRELLFNLSKKSAIIAVDEIIINGFNPQLPYNYWQEVKEEIEKL